MFLDLHRLHLLRELATRRTVTAVADALAYTPSAVSQQLRTLERELGLTLLERQGRGVVLTPAGRALVARADAVFDAADLATGAAERVAQRLVGPIHLGAFASAGATLIPWAVARLRRDHPDLEVRFTEVADAGLQELRLGRIDVWLEQRYAALPRPNLGDLEEHVLLTEPVSLAVPTEHDHGGTLAAHRAAVWIGGPPGSACRRLLEALSERAGIQPDVRYVTEDLEPTLQLVAAGVGVAILPRLATLRVPDGVRIHTLDEVREVVAVTRPGTSARPALAAALEALHAAGDEHRERTGYLEVAS